MIQVNGDNKMAKKIIQEEAEEVKEAKEVVEQKTPNSREVLETRQRELLLLIDTLQKEGVHSIGDLEVKLSIVNRDLAAL